METGQTNPAIREGPSRRSAGDSGHIILGVGCIRHLSQRGPNFVGGAREPRL